MAVVGDIYEAINRFSAEETVQQSTETSPKSVAEQKVKTAITIAEPEEISEQPVLQNVVTEVKAVVESPLEEMITTVETEKVFTEVVQPVVSSSNKNDNFQKNEKKEVIPIEVDWRKKHYRKVLWKRLVAFLLDHLVMIPVSFGIIFLYIIVEEIMKLIMNVQPKSEDITDGEIILYLLIGFVAYLIINAKMESSKWRGTLGKRILKLQITDKAGEPVTFFRAMIRNILRTVVGYLFIILLPFQYFRFKKTKKLFHDELSRTVIGEKVVV